MKSQQSPTRITWHAMKRRCLDPKHPEYYNYGGRGITVCEKWLSFDEFIEEMGYRPDGRTIDRIDNNLGYYKENCRWATQNQQNYNRNKSFVIFNGEKVHYKDLCEKYNIRPSIFSNRYRNGWSIEDIIRNSKKRKCEEFTNVPDVSRKSLMMWFKDRGCTLESIGNYFGVCRERVRQIISK
jgi:hypothetical protein